MLCRLAAYVAWLLEEVSAQHPRLTFRHGVHANPTLLQMHVHIISQDFQGAYLTNKRVYNSFQPPFLVPVDSMLLDLRSGLRVCALIGLVRSVGREIGG